MADDDHRAATDRGDPEKSKGNGPSQPDATSGAPDFASAPPAEGFDKMEAWQAEVARLAALPPFESDRLIKEVVKSGEWPGLLVSTLRKEVERARRSAGEEGATGQGSPIELPEIEPWPEPVDGAELVSDIVAQIRRFIVLPKHAAVAVALWVLFAYAHAAAFHSPRLAVRSPVHRCGKSTLLRVIGMLVVRKVTASSVTAAATFRVIEATKDVVLLIDEFDTVDPEKAGELRAVVNAGHCKLDAYVIRTVTIDGAHVVRSFSCWAPTVVASNKALPVTWVDRSITIRMKRKPRSERVEGLRDDVDLGFDALASRTARWAADNIDALRGANPQMPPVLNDRQADNWRMLIAIADRLGDDWGRRAREAAEALSTEDFTDAEALGELLLADIRGYFEQSGKDRAPSEHLVIHLGFLEGRPWAEYHRGGSRITANQLANLLRPFGISSQTIRWEEPPPPPPHGVASKDAKPISTTPKGYMREAFEAAWNCYLSQDPPIQAATTPQATETATFSLPQAATYDSDVADAKGKNPKQTATCGVVAAQNPPPGEKTHAKGATAQAPAHPNGPESEAGIPFMITQAMKAALRARGFTVEQIKKMTPAQAHAHLAAGNGVSVEDLKDLCRRAAEAKGKVAVEVICVRHGITRFGRRLEELNPEQEQDLRAALEALL